MRIYSWLFYLIFCLFGFSSYGQVGTQKSGTYLLFEPDKTSGLLFGNQSFYGNDSLNAETYDFSKPDEKIHLRTYFANYAVIPYYAVKEVFRTDQQGLGRNIFLSKVIAASFFFDLTIRELVQEEMSSGHNTLSRFLFYVGCKEYFLPGFAAAYGLSLITGNRYFHDTMILSFQSLIITQGFTELFKNSVQRVRPRHSPDDPFLREKGHQSFISGHASGTWAVMTVVAGRYPRLKYGAYAFATAVALARVYEDAHWTSDVLVGALVGYGIGQLTLKLNESVEHNLTVAPFFDNKANGVSLIYRF